VLFRSIGIAKAHQDRLFEEYFQVENPERDRSKGLGLGLAIVKRLSTLLASEVVVRSVAGRGSCFSLPLTRCAPGSTASSEPAAPLAPSFRVGRPLLVFIDDDPAILEAMITLIELWDIDLAAGSDAAEVKAELLELGREPDALLCDYRLRDGYTGIEAVAELRAQFGADLPAALLTGDTGSAALEAIQASGLPLLHKPLKPAKLRAFLTHLLAERANRKTAVETLPGTDSHVP